MTNMEFKNGSMQLRLLATYGDFAFFVKEKSGEHVVAWQPTFDLKEMRVSWSGGTYLGSDYESSLEVWKEKIGFTPVMVQFNKIVVPVTMEIEKSKLDGYIEDALREANYWVGIHCDTQAYQNAKDSLRLAQKSCCLGDILAEMLVTGRSLDLYDIEDEDEQWTLNLKQFIVGIHREMQRSGCGLDDISWDCVLQMALFNEITYS